MPYVQLPVSDIRISIPDLTVENTTVKREAYVSYMKYDNDAKRVVVDWVVQHFAAKADGSKGEYLGAVIPDYIRPNIADNNVMCDISTGAPIQPDENGEYPANVNYTGQYDFFYNLGESSPIIVNDVIRQFGLGITDWSKR